MKQEKKYADTDFFLSIMKDSDWLKEKAKEVFSENKGNIWVTPFTVAEIMIVCKREGIPIREVLIEISRIAKLDSFSWELLFRAEEYMKKGASIFDSLLMAFCRDDKIISSDKIFEKFGFEVIDLKNK